MIVWYIKNNLLVWFVKDWVGWIPKEFDIIDDTLTDDNITNLVNWGIYKYSYTDQQNITWDAIVSWDNTELEKMRVFVNAMLDELHTNWKDADFSEINP